MKNVRERLFNIASVPGRGLRALTVLALAFALFYMGGIWVGLAQDLDFNSIGPLAREQINALLAEKEARTPVQQKIDSKLLLTMDALSPRARFPVLHAIARPLPKEDGRLTVDIDLFDADALDDVLAVLASVQAEVIHASAPFHAVRARVNPLDLETVAARPGVRFVDSEQLGDTGKATTSEGDVTHKANLARSTLGYTGNGQKVCVLSDGVSTMALRQATGDLPGIIDVLPGQGGSGDEGTAMLEIVYDLAPGARQGFATALGGQAAMAQNILDLADPAKGGCTIINDDYAYFAESPFQDSVIAQAVNTVGAAGVLYFTHAANSGNLDSGTSGTWEGTFNAPGGVTSALIPGHVLHEFVAGVTQNVGTKTASHSALHWAEAAGHAATDYDLYVLNAAGTAVIGSSTNTQNGTQNAYEFAGPASGTFPAGSRVVVAKKTGAADKMLWVQWYRSVLTYGTSGATKGHSAVPNAFGVAATPAVSPGPYPSPFNASDVVEPFSSDGPRRIFFDSSGNLLSGAPAGNFTATGGVVRNVPDITAADGVATSAQGFNPFYGTSAAAPHAAAIAALYKQAFPAVTVPQFRTALAASALDIHAPGWDRTSGAGIARPLELLQGSAAPAIAGLSVLSATPAEVNGNGNGQLDAGEDWKFDIVLANIGGVAGTGIVATLVSNTPGIVVTSPPVSYPNIAVGANAANPGATPFRFTDFGMACGQKAYFTLSVVTAQSASAQTFRLMIDANALGSPQTFSYTGPSVAIPDGAGSNVAGTTVAVNLPVSGISGPIGDVNLRIDGLNSCSPNSVANAGIDHSYVGDLVIGLKAPDNSTITAISRMGNGTTAGPNLCNATLDDEGGGTTIGTATDAAAPFTGSWLPGQALSAFRGKSANGTWQLTATDWYAGDTGHVNRFSVIVTPYACLNVSRPVTMTATKTVAGTFAPNGTVTYTVTLTNTGTGVQADNAGDEYVDALPGVLVLVPASTTANKGTLTTSGNTVHWNGSLDAGASVVLTIVATVKPAAAGLTVTSQGTVSYDANHDGVNEATLLTDDPGVAGSANPTAFTVSGVAANLDIDGNGSYDALTDGLLILRYLFGLTNSALINGAIGPGALRNTAPLVQNYLATLGTVLDIDGNAHADALTDGLLILRYLFGIRGPSLIAGALAPGAPRNTYTLIEADILSKMP